MSPATFTKSPRQFLANSKMLDFCIPSDCGLFHVTTQADILEKQRRLKSRDELLDEDVFTTGLAGGPSNVVSTTISLSRALTLWGAMRSLSRCIHGTVPYSELLTEFFHWTGFPDSPMWSRFFAQDSVDVARIMDRFAGQIFSNEVFDSFRFTDKDLFRSQRAWIRFVQDESDALDQIAGYDVYINIQSGENFLANFDIPPVPGKIDNDLCSPLIGFASTYRYFREVSPDQISVVQLAAKVTAKPAIVRRECELRFLPKDTRIVRRRVEERGMIEVP